MMVVAVPTKNSDAFSLPDSDRWNFTSFGGGRSSGIVTPLGRSRVAGRSFSGFIKIRCMVSVFILVLALETLSFVVIVLSVMNDWKAVAVVVHLLIYESKRDRHGVDMTSELAYTKCHQEPWK